MIVGFDFYKTITVHPEIMRQLASSLISEGHKVLVISALGIKRSPTKVEDYRKRVEKYLEENHFPYYDLDIVSFEKEEFIPDVKLEACKRLRVDLYIDDRRGVCKMLNKNGIVALRVGDGVPPIEHGNFFNKRKDKL